MKFRREFFLSALAVAFFVGCRRDDQIQTYRVSKEADAAPAMEQAAPSPDMNPASEAPDMSAPGADAGMAPAGSTKEVGWNVPDGWKELPPSSMRIGSFQVKGDNGQTTDVSVVPLSGDAGGNLANINRWRGQINLPPISETDLANDSQTISPAGRDMLLIDFVSHDLLINDQYKKRVVSAIYTQGERTWFFKMMGDDQTTEAAKPAFLQFLKSLRFKAS